MKLRFTSRAVQNIAAIADYLREHNPAAARRVREAIYDSLRNLILLPQVGRPQQTRSLRKFVTRKYSYLVYYMIDETADEIVILSIKHPAQGREHKDAGGWDRPRVVYAENCVRIDPMRKARKVA